MTPTLGPSRRAALRRRLAAWYGREHRDLPWRRTRDPYRIWLSEAMLQQTRVETVIPYYERFLARFPDLRALARADEQDVLRLWAGLGYYSRARNLRRAAAIVVRDHAGALPHDERSLRALPGVGAYTAGALRSLAFRERAALVDGNVARVLARWLARDLDRPALWSLAGELVPPERPDLFNQALMELGAVVCTPRAPRCPACPVSTLCRARALGQPERFPRPRARATPREVRALAGLVERARPRRVLLLRRPSRGLLGGLWELPTADGDDPRALVATLRERAGVRARPAQSLGEIRHLFSHRALRLRVIRLDPSSVSRTERSRTERGAERRNERPDVRWCRPADLAGLPLSTLTRKTLQLAGLQPAPRGSGRAAPLPSRA